MTKILMLSKSYIKKAQGQTFSFFLIIIIAAILLNIGLITLLNYNQLFDSKSEALNTADLYFVMNEMEYSNDIYDYVKNSDVVKESELLEGVLQLGEFQYGDNLLSNMNLFLNADNKNNISKFSIVETLDITPQNGIYVPYMLKAAADYKLGDDFILKVANKEYHYIIAGFVEEMMTGSATSTNMGFWLQEDDFLRLRDTQNGIYKAKMINVKLHDKDEVQNFISEVNNYMSIQFPHSNLRYSASHEYIKFARTGVASIGSSIIIAFSMLIVCVALILTRFRIHNSIESDMKNIGALKALGYTSNQLIFSFITQFAFLAGIGSLFGIGISYILLPFVRDLFTSNSGMVWLLNFNLICFFLTILLIVTATSFIAYMASKRIKKLPPITALRGGVLTHSFKKNVLPFDKVKGNINHLIAIKCFLQGMRQNVMIFAIVVAVFFQVAFGLVFYYNAVIEKQNFINLVTGEIGDAILVLNTRNYDEALLLDIQNEPKVRKAFHYDTSIPVTIHERQMISGVVNLCEDFSINENPKIYEGRSPIHDNEVALKGTAALEMKKEVGDTLNLVVGNQSFRYLITGLMQDGNGTYATQMTYAAYQKLVQGYKPTMILLYLNEGEHIPDFLDYVNDKYEGKISVTQNSKEQVYSIIRPMVDTMKMALSVIVGATFCIISLILHIVIKTNIIRRKTELGIQKSLGFTTFQLMFQNTFALMPSFFMGAIIGGILSKLFMNKIASLVMRSSGVMKVTFAMPVSMLIYMGAGISIFAFFASMVISIRLRKITVYSLIHE